MTTSNFEKYQSQNLIQQRLMRNFENKLLQSLAGGTYESVFDAGCGEGFGLDLLRRKKIGKNWRGIDFSAEAIRVGQGLFSDLTLEKGSIYQIPVADKSYDLVLCCEVLEHLERPRAALKELLRIARGDIFLSVPNEPWFQLANLLRGKYIRDLGNHPEHINHWSVNEFEKLLVAENLTIELTETPFPWIQVLLRT